MKTVNSLTSACRYCRHYQPEGRRGGTCHQLGVPVQGSWKSCSLGLPAFAPTWESLEGIVRWPNTTSVLPEPLPIACVLDRSTVVPVEQGATSTVERRQVEPMLV